MWKLCLTLGLLFSVCSMAGCDVQKMSTLSELSRPYAGVYTCDSIRLGGQVISDSALSLELTYGGDFTLTYRTPNGDFGAWSGTYTVDETAEEITMSATKGSETLSRTYRFEDGVIYIDENFLGRPFIAEFKMG